MLQYSMPTQHLKTTQKVEVPSAEEVLHCVSLETRQVLQVVFFPSKRYELIALSGSTNMSKEKLRFGRIAISCSLQSRCAWNVVIRTCR